MGRRGGELEPSRWGSLVLLLMGLVAFSIMYIFMSFAFRPPTSLSADSEIESSASNGDNLEEEVSRSGGRCKGIQNLELWGKAVKWGANFKLNSPEDCCKACKDMCSAKDGHCSCDTWVFCGNEKACGERFGEISLLGFIDIFIYCHPDRVFDCTCVHLECWLKKQRNVLAPDKQGAGNTSIWTSGLIFGRGEISSLFSLGLILHFSFNIEGHYWFGDGVWYSSHQASPRLLPSVRCIYPGAVGSAPLCRLSFLSVRKSRPILECEGIKDASFGPPFALIQGTLEATGQTFNKIPSEHCPTIRRGSVAWVGSGPEFFISLACHEEWRKSYIVFGAVLPEDMVIAEKIAQLPTNQMSGTT